VGRGVPAILPGAVASSWYGAVAMLVDAVVIWLSFSAR
jgi:hypothetical protein